MSLLCLLFLSLSVSALQAQTKNSQREVERAAYEQQVIQKLGNSNFNDIPWISIFNDSKLRPSQVKQVFEQKLATVDRSSVNSKILTRFQFYLEARSRFETNDGKHIFQDEALAEMQQYYAAHQAKGQGMPTANFTYKGQNTSIFNTNNGRIERVNFHPTDTNIVWASAPEGGLWRSNNTGGTWTQMDDFWTHLSVGDLVYNLNDYDTVYCSTDDHDSWFNDNRGVLRSDNGGNTWNIVGLPNSTCSQVFKLAMAPDGRTLYACTNEGLFKSSDHGVTWVKNTALPTILRYNDIEFHPTNPQIIYVTTRSGDDQKPTTSTFYDYFYVSTDGGVSFSTITCPLNSKGKPAQVSVTPDNPDIVYISVYPDFGSGILPNAGGMVMKYTQSTANLVIVTGPSYVFPVNNLSGAWDFRFEVNPIDENHLFYGSVEVCQSLDGGTTWTKIPSLHTDQHDFKWQTGTNKLWFADDGGLSYSTDGGTNWTAMTNIPVTQLASIRSSRYGDNFLIGLQDAGIQVNMDGHWFEPLGGDGLEVAVDPVDTFTVYGSIQIGSHMKRIKYDPNTQTYSSKTIMSHAIAGTPATWRQKIIIDCEDHNTIYTNYQDIFKSIDQGDTWINLTNGTFGNGTTPIEYIYQSKTDAAILVAGWSSTMKRTTDGGTTWSTIAHPGGANLNGRYNTLVFSPTDANAMWACGGGNVLKTIDGGTTWTTISGTLPSSAGLISMYYQEGTANGLWVSGDFGTVWYRDDNTTDWVYFNTGLPHVQTREIEVVPHLGKVRVATDYEHFILYKPFCRRNGRSPHLGLCALGIGY